MISGGDSFSPRYALPPGTNASPTNMCDADDSEWAFEISYRQGVPHANYRSRDDVPRFTEAGFEKVRAPERLHERILNFHRDEEGVRQPEFDPEGTDRLGNYIWSDEVSYPSYLKPLPANIISYIFGDLIDIHTRWAGVALEPTFCYGIREYGRGAVLKKHRDVIESRVVSSIINVAQEVDEPWALQIEDHQGEEHEVCMEPGDMILYESARLMHGREVPLVGESYANIFCHFVNMEMKS